MGKPVLFYIGEKLEFLEKPFQSEDKVLIFVSATPGKRLLKFLEKPFWKRRKSMSFVGTTPAEELTAEKWHG